MEHSFHWSGDPEDLLIETSGEATLAGLTAMTQDAFADKRFKRDMKILLDHRRLDWSHMSIEDTRQRATDLVGASDRLGHARIAVVVSQPVDFGMQRMMEGLGDKMVEDALVPPPEFRSEVFRSLESAREWLRAHNS